MAQWIRQSTAYTFQLGPFVDETTGKDAEPSLTIAYTACYLSKAGGAFAAKTDTTNLTGTGDALGYYDCVLDATDTGTLGTLRVHVHVAGALPVWQDFMVVNGTLWNSYFSGTAGAIPAIVAGAAGGLFIAGTNATTTVTTALTANITGNLSGSVGSVTGAVGSVTGAVGSVAGAVGSVTGNVGGNVVGSVASVTGAVGSVTGIVTANVTQIGGVAQSATDLKDFADTGYDPATHKVAGVVLTDTCTTLTGHTAQTGDCYARIGAPAGVSVSADVAALKAETASILADTTVIGATGGGLTSLAQASVCSEVRLAHLDADVSSRLAPTVAARTLDVSATGEAGIDWANVGSPTTAVGLSGTTISTTQAVASCAAATLTGDLTATMKTSVATAVLATPAQPIATDVNGHVSVDLTNSEDVETGVSMKNWFKRAAAVLFGKASGLTTTTVIFRDPGDNYDRVTATVDADGNRTDVDYIDT